MFIFADAAMTRPHRIDHVVFHRQDELAARVAQTKRALRAFADACGRAVERRREFERRIEHAHALRVDAFRAIASHAPDERAGFRTIEGERRRARELERNDDDTARVDEPEAIAFLHERNAA